MQIRLMDTADYDAVYSLWTHTPGMGLNDLDDSREGVESYLSRNPATCFVAEEDGQIIGAILSGHDGRRGYIYHTAVRRDRQRQGIGRKLVSCAMDALEQAGVHKVALVAFSRNETGNAFWEKMGFTERHDLSYRNKAIHDLKRFDTTDTDTKMEMNTMQYQTIEEAVAAIAPSPAEETAREAAHRQWASIAKPLGSLGLLETILEDIAALTCSEKISLYPRAVLMLCADNGVVRKRVSQTDHTVTAAVARNAAANCSSVCKMAAVANCKVVPVDMGIIDFPPTPNILDRRIGNGTADMTEGPAMSREQAVKAILTGIDLVREQKEQGVRLLATGEMGIGNTTTSSAVASVLLGCPVRTMTGRGAGLSDAGLRRKIRAIGDAVIKNSPSPTDPIDTLAKVGGFDLAGLCGVYLGGAIYRVPILVDGFISTVAALCAARICPQVKKAMFASHVSAEPAGRLILDELGKKPIITAEMRLGEGTGAVALMPMLDMALALYGEGMTFDGCGIEAYTPQQQGEN